MLSFTFHYKRNNHKERHAVYINAPNPAAAWALFEATYPPKRFTALTVTHHPTMEASSV